MGLFSKEGQTRRIDAPPAGESRPSDIQNLLQDLAAGAEYQQSIFPKGPPDTPGYDFGIYFRAARIVSGDFYDFIPLSGGRLGIAIADASGKGIPAGMATMTCRAMLRAQPDPDASPSRVLANVNRMLHKNIKSGMFISGIYAVLDPEKHTLDVANAGHLPLVVWRSKQKIATIYPSKGPVLGVLPPPAYEAAIKEESLTIGTGDRLVMLTDGVNEAMAPGQREFGMEHLRRLLRDGSDKATPEFLKDAISHIDIHRGGGEQSDDITIITSRRLA
jgi:sigma-B regulation protein RsbU (phosphoserine phosphatase)